jgi:hypothetical protein
MTDDNEESISHIDSSLRMAMTEACRVSREVQGKPQTWVPNIDVPPGTTFDRAHLERGQVAEWLKSLALLVSQGEIDGFQGVFWMPGQELRGKVTLRVPTPTASVNVDLRADVDKPKGET